MLRLSIILEGQNELIVIIFDPVLAFFLIRIYVPQTAILAYHSLIRGVLIQSCSARAKNFTNYVFCHPQLSGVIQNIVDYCAILTLIVYAKYY